MGSSAIYISTVVVSLSLCIEGELLVVSWTVSWWGKHVLSTLWCRGLLHNAFSVQRRSLPYSNDVRLLSSRQMFQLDTG